MIIIEETIVTYWNV